MNSKSSMLGKEIWVKFIFILWQFMKKFAKQIY